MPGGGSGQGNRLARWREHAAAAAAVVRANPSKAGMALPAPEVSEVEVMARDLAAGDLIVASQAHVVAVHLRRDKYADITIEEHDGVMHVGKEEMVTVARLVSDPPPTAELESYLDSAHAEAVAAHTSTRHGLTHG